MNEQMLLDEIRKIGKDKTPTMEKMMMIAVNVLSIAIMFFALNTQIKKNMNHNTKLLFESYLESDEFKTEIEDKIKDGLGNVDIKAEIKKIIVSYAKDAGITAYIEMDKDFLSDFVQNGIDKQLEQIKKCPKNIKLADLYFFLDQYEKIDKSYSYNQKIKEIKDAISLIPR